MKRRHDLNGLAPPCWADRRRETNRAGQAGLEMCLLIGCVVMALVIMATYAGRAWQGYLYANASGHGSQFDPTQPYSAKQTITQYKVEEKITFSLSPDVKQLRGQQDGSGSCDGLARPADCLPSVPGGGHPGRFVQNELPVMRERADVTVTTDWDIKQEAEYEAR